MQWARWVGGVGAMLAAAVTAVPAGFAAQGDALLVTGSNVNVRAGPSTEAGILARVGIDEPATELRRMGPWVEVALPGQDVMGWIHDSLLTAVPAPAAGPTLGAAPEPAPAVDAPVTVAAVEAPAADAPAARIETPAPAAQAAGPSLPEITTAAVPAAAVDSEPPPTTALGKFRSEVEHFNNRAAAAAGVDLFTSVKPLGEGGVQVVTTDAWAIMSQPGQQSYLNALFGRWQVATGGAKELRLEIVDEDGTLMMERTDP